MVLTKSLIRSLSEENIKIAVTSDNSFAPKLTFIFNGRIGEKFEESYLKQTLSYSQKCLFIVYELGTCSSDLNADFRLDDCLFEAYKQTKDSDHGKHGYNVCGIGFNAPLSFSFPNGEVGKKHYYFWCKHYFMKTH